MHSIEKPGTPEELVHFGVKGMKWGQRKASGIKSEYLKSTTARGEAQRRVGEGRGSRKDKLQVNLTTSSLSLDRARAAKRRGLIDKKGFQGAALVRANRTEAHVERIQNGEATVHDMLRMAGSVKVRDIRRGIQNY